MFKNSRKYHDHVVCFECVVVKSAVLWDLINLNKFMAELTGFKFTKMHAWTEMTNFCNMCGI
jgi:Fe2+ or Zn2+ uptake regulation protein